MYTREVVLYSRQFVQMAMFSLQLYIGKFACCKAEVAFSFVDCVYCIVYSFTVHCRCVRYSIQSVLYNGPCSLCSLCAKRVGETWTKGGTNYFFCTMLSVQSRLYKLLLQHFDIICLSNIIQLYQCVLCTQLCVLCTVQTEK